MVNAAFYAKFAVEQAPEFGHARRREIASGHDAEMRPHDVTPVRRQCPVVGFAVEQRGHHTGVQLHIAAQVEAIGNVVDVAQDFWLGAVAFRPFPHLLQVVGEGIGVLEAFDVAARAGIAVPEPGAANVRPGLESAHAQAHAAQAVDGVQPGQSAPDNGDVEPGQDTPIRKGRRVGHAGSSEGYSPRITAFAGTAYERSFIRIYISARSEVALLG